MGDGLFKIISISLNMKQKVMISFWVMALSLTTQNCQQQIKNKTVNTLVVGGALS